jgi:anaphase-promoting complex subunit 2
LGTAHLELELQDRKLDVTVPPLEAAFIEFFSQKRAWYDNEFGEM